MKKWVALLKSLLLSFVIYMWFLGSTLLISIDEQNRMETLSSMSKTLVHPRPDQTFQNEMDNLTRHISQMCSRLPEKFTSGSSMSLAEEKFIVAKREKAFREILVYIPELQQLWCLVPKAASTSWSRKIIDNLNKLNGKLQRDLHNASIPIQIVLRKHYGQLGTKVYNQAIHSNKVKRILLVRHPFSRLISAFEDKLRNRKATNDSMYFFSHYGVKINRAFRKNRRENKRKEPTFEEFVEYLLQTNPSDYDEHWKPISLLCGVCSHDYDHIIRQEDLNNPSKLKSHLSKLNFEDSNYSIQRANQKQRQHVKVTDYFQNISNEKITQLWGKYEDDFKLFRYDNPIQRPNKNLILV